MTIKTKEDGIEIEFESVEDLIQYRSCMNISKKQPEIQTPQKVLTVPEWTEKHENQPIKKQRTRYKRRLSRQDKIVRFIKIKEQLDKGLSWKPAYEKALGKQPYSEIKAAYFRLDKTRKKPRKGQQISQPSNIKHLSDEDYDKRFKKVEKYMIILPDISFSTAYKQAARENPTNGLHKKYAAWLKKSKESVSEEVKNTQTPAYRGEPFQTIKSITGGSSQILEGMVKKIIMQGGNMSWRMEGKILMMKGMYDWDIFVTDFLLKGDKIAAHFGVKNKFKATGRSRTIVYR